MAKTSYILTFQIDEISKIHQNNEILVAILDFSLI